MTQQKNSLHLHFHREIRTASNRNLLNIFELGLQRVKVSCLLLVCFWERHHGHHGHRLRRWPFDNPPNSVLPSPLQVGLPRVHCFINYMPTWINEGILNYAPFTHMPTKHYVCNTYAYCSQTLTAHAAIIVLFILNPRSQSILYILFFSILDPRFSILDSRSSILDSRFSILDPRFSILDSRFSILDPRSSILDPRSSILDPRSSILDSRFRSSILDPRSSILDPRFSILDSRSSILDPRSSILDPRFSILDPRFSILDPRFSILDLDSRFSILDPRSSILDSRSSILDSRSSILDSAHFNRAPLSSQSSHIWCAWNDVWLPGFSFSKMFWNLRKLAPPHQTSWNLSENRELLQTGGKIY